MCGGQSGQLGSKYGTYFQLILLNIMRIVHSYQEREEEDYCGSASLYMDEMTPPFMAPCLNVEYQVGHEGDI